MSTPTPISKDEKVKKDDQTQPQPNAIPEVLS